MNIRRKVMLAVAVVPLLLGCRNDALTESATDNHKYTVDLLFTHDGCRVYRFYDMRYRYFVRCDGATTASTVSSYDNGEVQEDEEIVTGRSE